MTLATVTIDLEEVDEQDLRSELRRRGYVVVEPRAPTPSAEAAYHSLAGKLDTLPEAARLFILDQAGRVA